MRLLRAIRKWITGTVYLSDYINLSGYYCIELNQKIGGVYQAPIRYLPNNQSLMKFLGMFGTKFKSAWDIDNDGNVSTLDMLALIGGYGRLPDPNPSTLALDEFELFGQFGEGNFWFEPLAEYDENGNVIPVMFGGSPVSFLWYHTTPYDETDVFIKINPTSFDLDVVFESGNIYTFTFVER